MKTNSLWYFLVVLAPMILSACATPLKQEKLITDHYLTEGTYIPYLTGRKREKSRILDSLFELIQEIQKQLFKIVLIGCIKHLRAVGFSREDNEFFRFRRFIVHGLHVTWNAVKSVVFTIDKYLGHG